MKKLKLHINVFKQLGADVYHAVVCRPGDNPVFGVESRKSEELAARILASQLRELAEEAERAAYRRKQEGR